MILAFTPTTRDYGPNVPDDAYETLIKPCFVDFYGVARSKVDMTEHAMKPGHKTHEEYI